jgi:hypothetical protein
MSAEKMGESTFLEEPSPPSDSNPEIQEKDFNHPKNNTPRIILDPGRYRETRTPAKHEQASQDSLSRTTLAGTERLAGHRFR